MNKAIESALAGAANSPEDIEIIIVDDGSSDATADIGRSLEGQRESAIRLISQPNGGHGAAVTTGVREATGTYVKILDSDDHLDTAALTALLEAIRSFAADAQPDVVITDYVYDNHTRHSTRRISYRGFVPAKRLVTWEQVKRPRTGRYFLMHALTYKRSVLIDSGLELPRHTFYVDNLYASVPLRHTRTLYYLPVPLYMYFIGREDQSVNEAVMITRLDQQLRVNRLMIDELQTTDIHSRALARYLLHYLTMITSVSLTFCSLAGTPEARQKGHDLLVYLKDVNPRGYRAYRRSPMNMALSVRGPGSHRFIRTTYRVIRKRFGFN